MEFASNHLQFAGGKVFPCAAPLSARPLTGEQLTMNPPSTDPLASPKSPLSPELAGMLGALPGLALVVARDGRIIGASRQAAARLGATEGSDLQLSDLLPRGTAMRLTAVNHGELVVRAPMPALGESLAAPAEIFAHKIAGTADLILITIRPAGREEALLDYLVRTQWYETCAAMAGGLAHSLNNALAAILGLSELIAMRTPPDSPIAPFPEKIATAVEKARQLVTRLSMMSRNAPGKATDEATALLIEELRPTFHAFLPSSVTLEVEIDANTPWCRIDRHTLEHILFNCLTFVRGRLRQDGGSVRIHCGPGPSADAATLHIQASGPGLEAPDTDAIFELDLTPAETAYDSRAALFVARKLATEAGADLTAAFGAEGLTLRIDLPPAPPPEED